MLKVDLHIARTFLAPFAVITAAAVGLYVVGDALGQLDDFFEGSDSLGELLVRMSWAYLCRLPVFLTPVVPMTLLVSGAFAIGHLARNNEITALKASGVSLHRMLIPVYVCAALVSLVAFASQELLVPVVEQRFLPRIENWTESGPRFHRLMGFVEGEDTRYIVEYNLAEETMRSVHLVVNAGGEVTLVNAERGAWTGEGWRLYGPQGVTIKRGNEETQQQPEYLWRTSLTPGALAAEIVPLGSRPLHVILRYVRAGYYTRRHLLILYDRLAYPLVGVVLLLAGIPFMLTSESVKKSRLVGVGLCIFIGGTYYAVKFVSADLAQAGSLPAAAGGFLAVVLFGAVGVYLTDRTPT